MTYQLHPYQTNLVNKTRQSLATGHKAVLIVSPAGSGKSVVIAEIARMATEKGGHVMFMVHRRELVEQIMQTFIADDINLQHCTIMTVGKIIHRMERLPKPTLIITDESHHALAKTYQKIYEHYPDVARVGFTATPWRMSGKGFTSVYDDMIVGPEVQWLIENHYLADYTYYAPTLIDSDKLKRSSTGDYTQASMNDAIKEPKIFGDVLAHYKRLTEGRQAIVYAHSVEASMQVAEMFKAAGISAAHADAKTPQRERDSIMRDFKAGKIRILCNVDLISEGFNVPDVGVIIMLRPTASLVLYIQQAMRGMRYEPGKHAIIIDHVGNVMRFGPPRMPRADQWTLYDRKKKKRSGTPGPAIKTCPKCFAIVPAATTVCKLCGYVWETAETEDLEVDKTVKLGKLEESRFMVADYQKTHWAQKEPREAKNYTELRKIANARGYKPGWAYFQAKNLGLLKTK
ncbi:DEAD/DEAH box helicase [Schleiferilactobacillus harbinensis]|uniref:AAA family ATPase n=1 Tax=Schleiferilactobacillus harbinensis TaxID=304207 RepID=A0A5P8M618_9LACO|nr:DEAD/DEAH box helicase [Schleiferilactobacillus harbinensis]QFR23724.1 AAA family ATPase [Schleiferilactobacillus harbinensis]